MNIKIKNIGISAQRGASPGAVGLWAAPCRPLVPRRKSRQVCVPQRVRRARTGRGMSCSPETEQGRVGRRVPPPSPGARPGHPALCALRSAASPPVQVWASCEHPGGSPQHPPPALTPLSPFPLLPSVCPSVPHRFPHTRPGRDPSGGRRSGAAQAWGSGEEKIMNEMDAVLRSPRPPSPGNLSAGAVPAGTPSPVWERGSPKTWIRD